MIRKHSAKVGIGVAAVVGTVGATGVAALSFTGPSSAAAPYLVATADDVDVVSILTVGDTAANGYEMVGIPDGLGAFDNGDGTFTLLMNHELRNTVGGVRLHGSQGAFVSKWTIDSETLAVEAGEDLIDDLYLWDGDSYGVALPGDGALNRLCSADLAPLSAFYDEASGKGYDGRIFMNGEESGAEGRAFAHFVTGPEASNSYELPDLGKFSWENSVAHPDAGDQTVVIGLDDSSSAGQLYVYVGDKQATGSAVERAGLAGGKLYGVQVSKNGKKFGLVDVTDLADGSGAALDAGSVERGVTAFARPEDGAWNPSDPSQFIFATTASFTENSELISLDFKDPANPAKGGKIEVLASTEEFTTDSENGPRMMDNVTVDDDGHVLVQEDPGGQAHYAAIWKYDLADDTMVKVLQHDPARYTAPFDDEESSGIIAVDEILGDGWFLADVQSHSYPLASPLVEDGQLVAIRIGN